MYDYNDFKGNVFIFIGQNASTGKPNKITGNRSFFGQFFSCKNLAEARKAAERVRNPYDAQIVDYGCARKLRQYDLGPSVATYLESLYFALPVSHYLDY